MAGIAASTNSTTDSTNDSTDLLYKITGTSSTDFQTMKLTSDTMKKNPKLDFSQTDLLKLLSYLEGELQARDVVIAALRSENVKQVICANRLKPLTPNDPTAAFFRDNLASVGHIASRESSAMAAQTERNQRIYARQQLEILEGAVLQQRNTHTKLLNLIKHSEEKHNKLLNDLEEEKQKHERDTAQGDDITYGLEVERTRLKQDLESERQTTKKLEKELKKCQDSLETERNRQKTIVLLLLAERKRIITKYIEERKRSEDLAQILSEEKQRVDSMAEGLEEESKKSLRMEAELEKQLHMFEIERKQIKSTLSDTEMKIRDQEQEILHLKAENEFIRKQTQQRMPINIGVPQLVPKGLNARSISDSAEDVTAASSMISSVTKVVQPTATVSSVPVSGPMTGIARSISPGQPLRQISTEISALNTAKVIQRKLSNTSSSQVAASIVASATASTVINTNNIQPSSSSSQSSSQSSSPSSLLQSHGQVNKPSHQMISQTTATVSSSSHISTIKKNPAALPLGRGVPPPIPPNKPVVPPKREPSATRLNTVGNFINSGGIKENNLIIGTSSSSSSSLSSQSSSSSSSTSSISSSSSSLSSPGGQLQKQQQISTGVAVATSGQIGAVAAIGGGGGGGGGVGVDDINNLDLQDISSIISDK